jgi:prephenate dehydrogenase
MKAQNVSIVGLSRLGASIGLAVQQSSLDVQVVGHDRDPDVARIVRDMGAVDKVEANVRSLAEKADILVLAVPASELEPLLSVIGDVVQPHALLLDLSNLKGLGLKLAAKHLQAGHYVGASAVFAADWLVDGRTEVEAASGGAFKNSIFCLMPSPQADPKAVETAVQFGKRLGATPYFVDPLEYDGLLTGVQTVPGLLAAALFQSVTQEAGWRDMLRFAGVPFAMSTQPLANGADIAAEAATDKIATLRWLDALMASLKRFRRQVYDDDIEMLTATLENLFVARAEWLESREENDWVEGKLPEVEGPSWSSYFLGALGSRSKKQSD